MQKKLLGIISMGFVPSLLVILLYQREYQGVGGGGGMKTTGKIRPIEVTENNLLYCSQVT